MKHRRLGTTGLTVSAIGHGRGARAIRFGDPLESDFADAVVRAADLGVNFFDTADAYWGTRHEVLLGRVLRGRRDRVLIASKFGNIDLPTGGKGANGRPEYVFEACEASLARIGVDTIDLYYLHRVDPAVPIEDTIGAMARLVEQGKVRHLGICEASPATLRRAHAVHPMAVLQTEYSLWFRDPERELIPTCRELGIGYVAYAPLGRGLLTGRIRTPDDLPEGDRRRTHPRFQGENLARNVALVTELAAIAERNGLTPAQLAIAWLLAQGDEIVPIPGTNHAANVELNAAAVEAAVPAQDLQRLSDLFAPGAGAGERYPAHILGRLGL